jgi:hypothetical protein
MVTGFSSYNCRQSLDYWLKARLRSIMYDDGHYAGARAERLYYDDGAVAQSLVRVIRWVACCCCAFVRMLQGRGRVVMCQLFGESNMSSVSLGLRWCVTLDHR